MADTLIRAAQIVLTMDDARSELADADILISGGVIKAVGQNLVADGANNVLSLIHFP